MDFILPPHVINETQLVVALSQTASWGIDQFKIRDLHRAGLTGMGIRVAVIDTGIDANHADLRDRIIEMHNTSGEPDAHTNGHGIATTGIIAASDDDFGTLGVAPDCEIIFIKGMRENGSGSYRAIIDGMKIARQSGARVINLSLGGVNESKELENCILEMEEAGILVVCAAGNSGKDNSVMYPGRYQTAFCVGASNKRGEVSAFSSRGWEVDIAAPGERILAPHLGGGHATVTGSSFAAPFVSGVFALLLQADIKITHNLLSRTATDIGEEGLDEASGYGLINPMALLEQGSVQGELDLSNIRIAIDKLNLFLQRYS